MSETLATGAVVVPAQVRLPDGPVRDPALPVAPCDDPHPPGTAGTPGTAPLPRVPLGRARRVLDVAGALVLLLLVLPVLAAAALAVLLVDGRPVLFRQARDGLGGVPLTVVKLRTMRRDAPQRLAALLAGDPARRAEWQRCGGLVDDPRVLGRVGRLLRRTSVDELPQLWQVLRGQLTLVGPRPVELAVARTFPAAFLAERRRHVPGVTGPWQVGGRSDLDLAALAALEQPYLSARSLRADVRLLVRTPWVVLTGAGAR